MFKKIWKAVKWLFTIDDQPVSKVRGKLMHSQPEPEKFHHRGVRLGDNANTAEIFETLKSYVIGDGDVIETLKQDQLGPILLTHTEMQYVIDNCDITVDPRRLEEMINFALNIHSIKVQDQVKSILDNNIHSIKVQDQVKSILDKFDKL